jgi:hypothetical protein
MLKKGTYKLGYQLQRKQKAKDAANEGERGTFMQSSTEIVLQTT